MSAWTSTAAAAILHGTILFAGSQAAAAPAEEAERESIDTLRRYLAASEAREAPRDTVEPESQGRVLNRLPEGANGAGAGGDDTPGEGTENKASSGHLSAAPSGEGSGKKDKGAGTLPQYKFRTGKLPAEVIQRIVRQNFGRFRLCFEQKRSWGNPFSRVSVRFVIGVTGAVVSAKIADTTEWEQEVNTCVRRGFLGLSFPEPQGGVVIVTYPIAFTPGG